MKKLKFIKMHGLGNDFVIIDRRRQDIEINNEVVNKISNRKTGAGCDQIITIDKASSNSVDAKVIIFNSNGDQAEACGNGTRCVAKILFENLKKEKLILETVAGKLIAEKGLNGNISINMGQAKESWKDIGISKEVARTDFRNRKVNTRDIPIYVKNFSNGFAISIGNPHLVFFGKEIDKLDLLEIGPIIENNNLFLNKINVEFVEIINKEKIKMRVWERSVGETLACGSGACAAVYAGYIKKNISDSCEVGLKNGSLFIKIINNNEVIMTGPAEISYYGDIVL